MSGGCVRNREVQQKVFSIKRTTLVRCGAEQEIRTVQDGGCSSSLKGRKYWGARTSTCVLGYSSISRHEEYSKIEMERSETMSETSDLGSSGKSKRKQKVKDVNPIESALRVWLSALPEEIVDSPGLSIERLLEAAPKRWVVYPPMILLPPGSFRDDYSLHTQGLEKEHRDTLWREILARIGKKEGKGLLTHLAINSGIPLNSIDDEGENVLRSPSGLVMLYGDFGPNSVQGGRPSEEDFGKAFWVKTKQNGITQVWAPRWTMFSRGNVKEKARLLGFHSNHKNASRRVEKRELEKQVAVDLYAGIGYFVFSYVGMGMGRVFGWELNPWSVEGLRRGALANGWSVNCVKGNEAWVDGAERIIVFEEDNRKALQRLRDIQLGNVGPALHINGGLLPSSEATWKMSLDILDGTGWLHLHENVGVHDVELRKAEIENKFLKWMKAKEDTRDVKLEHVEFVKTFAPGVWHCVFDVYTSN